MIAKYDQYLVINISGFHPQKYDQIFAVCVYNQCKDVNMCCSPCLWITVEDREVGILSSSSSTDTIFYCSNLSHTCRSLDPSDHPALKAGHDKKPNQVQTLITRLQGLRLLVDS